MYSLYTQTHILKLNFMCCIYDDETKPKKGKSLIRGKFSNFSHFPLPTQLALFTIKIICGYNVFACIAYTRELELRGKRTFPNWMLTLAHFVILSMCAFVIIGLICCVARICFIAFIANKKKLKF